MTTADLAQLADLLADKLADRTAAPPLIDAKGAAEILGVPASWVLAEARAQRIPHCRLGKYVRFDVAELRAWATSRAVGPRGQR